MLRRRLIFITNFSETGRGTFNVAQALLSLPSFEVIKFDVAGRKFARGPLRTPLTLLQLLFLVLTNRRAMIFADTGRGIDLVDRVMRLIGERPYVLRYGATYTPPDKHRPRKLESSLAPRLRLATLVIVASHASKIALAEGTGRALETIAVAHNGDDREIKKTRHEDARQPINLLCIGRLDYNKRPELAVACLGELVALGVDARLTLIGGGDPAGLRAQAEQLGVTHLVHFAGFMAEPWAAMPANAVLLHPSRKEGFGYAVLEAIARGVPVIVVEGVGGAEEIVQITGGGTIVQADGRSMAQAVRALTADPVDLARTMEKARGIVKDYFSIQRMVADYDRLLLSAGIGG